jgi:serine/threonine protein kinase/tetratricopeptide (TPR) repeat protein
MSTPPSSDETVFAAALERSPVERAAFLDAACAGNPARRARIDSLLRAHAGAADFLESPPDALAAAAAVTTPVFPPAEKPGDSIGLPAIGSATAGRYKLLQKIGEGGCGTVYLAEQQEPVVRRVALKVIKLGMDTKEVIARFEAERQALALMDHPNIARVFDGGATDTGRPFFVMELVRGVPITKFCDERNLPTAARLELFTSVCHAVQHAHQKGIIHRDLKPSNILVTLHDGRPVPKVIDFGIAKATHGRLTDNTLFTAFEQFIGTPAYMSPEQAELSGLDIDTRSDIYSLGVLLYELLTGRTPFDPQTLVAAGIDEIRRIIREVDPPRPSARLSTLTDADRATIASQRGLAPAALSFLLRGDLDWIVMRCLEKDRSRRYETANGLVLDIQRHLQNEPVSARPPRPSYVLAKLIRRHRFAVGAGAAVAATLAAGFAVSTMLFWRERATLQSLRQAREAEAVAVREKTRAEVIAENESRLRSEAESGRREAQREAARRVSLATATSAFVKNIGLHVSMSGERRALQEVIDQATTLKQEFGELPTLEASLEEAVAGAHFRLGDLSRAEESFLRAQRLHRRGAGERSPEVAQVYNYLGLVHSARSDWADALQCHRDALELQRTLFGTPHPQVARTHGLIGTALARMSKLGEAEHFLRLSLNQHRVLGTTTELAPALSRLASVLVQDGRIADAELLLREALEIQIKAFGRESLEAAAILNQLSVAVALHIRRLPEAMTLYLEAFAIRERLKSPEPSAGLTDAIAASKGGPAAKRDLTISDVLSEPSILADIRAVVRDAQIYSENQFGSDSWESAHFDAMNTWILLHEQRFAEAEKLARRCLATRLKLRPDDWSTDHARHMLGAAIVGLGRHAEAEQLLVDGYRAMKKRSASIPPFHGPRVGEAAQRILNFYRSIDRPAEAEMWRSEIASLEPPHRPMSLPSP